MTPERWQQVDKLLEQALEREPAHRAAFLEEACNGDAALRKEVESLLSAHGKAGGFTEAAPIRKPARGTGVEEPELLTGRQIGHYQILSRLGEGGMGVVYKARDTHLDRFVAIKVLPPELVADPDRKRRFVQEAKAASALKHPNIITIHDIASDNGTDFMVMEYVQGKTLGQLIPRRGLKLNDALKVAIQIADALAKAQAAGIIHRDLKPGNIMVDEGGLVKVLDFGLAKLTERPQIGEEESTRSIPPWTDEGTILGTASYMSPEQAAGRPVDARSDIFSFGSVLYEMVTGQRAFQGDSKMSILAAVLNQEPKATSEISRGLPRDLEKIITRCLRKDPERRFQHMADLKVALEELKEESVSGLLGVKEGPDSSGKPKRVARPMLVTLALVGASLAATAWFWFRHSNMEQPDAALTAVPLTSYPGWEDSPTFSPDGNQVAFSWSKSDNGIDSDIYLKQVGVEGPSQFTDHPAPDLNPAWSPDGLTIAFTRMLSPGKMVYIVKPQRGGSERTIAESEVLLYSSGFFFTAQKWCAWTPNSKSLVVVGKNSPEEPPALFLVSVETLEKRQLTYPPPGAADFNPAVAPDGRTLAFSRGIRLGQTDLCLLSLSEEMRPLGAPEVLSFGNPLNLLPTWTSDGLEILLVSSRTRSHMTLWRTTPAKSGGRRRLALPGEPIGDTAVSRQGGRLAYSMWRGDTNIWRIEVPTPSRGPTEAAKFASSTLTESEPAYSPDGKKIAFMSARSGSWEIWVADGDGSHPFELTQFRGPVTNRPRWSPDGKRIVFHSDAKGSRDVYVIRADGADGGKPKRLTTDPSTDTNASWSADGKWVYFESDRSGQEQIWKVSADGGEVVPVRGVLGSSPVESPDGKFLYFDKGRADDHAIWRVPTRGGDETQVIGSLSLQNWVAVDEGIYFISKPDEKGVSYIRFKDFATASVRTIAPIKGQPYWGFTVSPDRRTFLYAQSDESGSDLMLVENFR